ncbi:polysaccharide deacetylase [Salinimicrobium marinum]|uniref:Polysaccharide deacetylase n=1 Tax=Salinimicrobium marinum TaxID=680283 RepID=A0A918S497_9FLAO|nr:polysaccharide deacetylase family protein [Salinimicrobium marinum]GHA23858.1 polysaccharide deacetylase [Salinimicrobium marinum]
MATEEKILYLSFDDGPIPEVTPWVLQQLKKYNAKATFFCIGDNIKKHPKIFQMLTSDGHSVGNHTFNHFNGWKISSEAYLKNSHLAEEAIIAGSQLQIEKRQENKEKREESKPINLKLFRPPYGRMTGEQAQLLQERNYKIVMWDVLSRDYNKNISSKECFQNVIKHSSPGSIIVFHDSLKAEKNLRAVLPRVLEYYSSKGYSFRKIQL